MKEVEIYTDGAAVPNPGAGGWAALLIYYDQGRRHERMVSGNEPLVTNNQMELRACIGGLRALKSPCKVTIYSDSQLTVQCANRVWGINKNRALWDEYFALAQLHDISAVWVKGHAGHVENERVHNEAMRQAYVQHNSARSIRME